MDSALTLKIKTEQESPVSQNGAENMLSKSKLYKKLLADFDPTSLNLLWRLTQLAEIPFSYNHHLVRNWTKLLVEKTFTGNAFSLTGKNDYVLCCYNGMIASVLLKLGATEYKTEIEKAIEWILEYQNVERNQVCKWDEKAVQKYGGCLKSAPCYIGVAKSMIALSDYQHSLLYKNNKKLEEKLNKGLEYILDHNIYLRRSVEKPITNYITKLTYPFTYKTNIIELLLLLKANNRLNDNRCKKAKAYLKSKQRKNGSWYANYTNILKNPVWVAFDKVKEPGAWVTYLINSITD